MRCPSCKEDVYRYRVCLACLRLVCSRCIRPCPTISFLRTPGQIQLQMCGMPICGEHEMCNYCRRKQET